MKYLLLLSSLILLSSCSFFYKTVFRIKDPKMESYESINDYAKTLTIEPATLIFAKDSASQLELNQIFQGSPDILVFNKSKTFLPYKNNSSTCNGPAGLFLKNICDIESTHASIQREINYSLFLSLFDDHNHVLSALNDTTIDFIVFTNFVKYFPKVNTDHFIYWNKEFREHNGNCKAKIIHVNLDYMESWGMSKESLPRLRVKASSKNK